MGKIVAICIRTKKIISILFDKENITKKTSCYIFILTWVRAFRYQFEDGNRREREREREQERFWWCYRGPRRRTVDNQIAKKQNFRHMMHCLKKKGIKLIIF